MDTVAVAQEHPLFETEQLLARMDGDLDLLKEVVELFWKDAPSTLAVIEDAIRRQDAQTLYSAAHKLKGSVANFAAPEVYEAARVVEMMGRTENLSGAEEAGRRLVDSVGRLRVQLDHFVGNARS